MFIVNAIVGDNGKISYNIIGGDEKDEFSISQNGTITTQKSLDRETQSIYNLVVLATDQAKPPEKRLSSTVQVLNVYHTLRPPGVLQTYLLNS